MSKELNKALELLREIRPSIPKDVLELWCADRDDFLASQQGKQCSTTQLVGDLLAVIHRDGGHYQDEHGIAKALIDAKEVVNQDRIDLSEWQHAAETAHAGAKKLADYAVQLESKAASKHPEQAEGATPVEAVIALMSAERIDPEQESVEQAGWDERAAFEAWLAQAMSKKFEPEFDLAKYEDSGEYRYSPAAAYWKAWQARAALAQPSPVSEALIYACKNLAQITSSDGSGHADIAMAVLRMAGVGDDERERLVNEWKAARAWKPSPAQAEGAPVVGCLCGMPMTEGHHSQDGCCNLEEFAPQAQAEQAEAERPEVVGQLVTWPTGQRYVGRVRERKGCKTEDVMTVAQHERITAQLHDALDESDGDRWKLRSERDAALARVAELEKQGPAGAPMPDEIHQMAFEEGQPAEDGDGYLFSAEEFDLFVQRLLDSCAAPVAQPEETPGEILAAKLIETWVAKHGKPAPWSTAIEITAVATNMPNDERDRLLALDDDVDAKAQHSVPELDQSRSALTEAQMRRIYENSTEAENERLGFAAFARLMRRAEAVHQIAAAPGKEVGHE
ncbi:hypothetical protein APB53_14170 [Pseudomonas aeruginosa]|uniref:hypothetical protein n=1 Tax=Pseudomonas aeruginosa TaxID=287 RepID=UPI00071B7DBC|nr:hypothetical protein [Pseudomonas aeruginosa]KSR43128.1 hypothetical protein APB53_14170 [Pseudomonas aeruginosa]RPV08025.1 hypothetical protein IPC880_12145 [Pseudomonas aeruginosa]